MDISSHSVRKQPPVWKYSFCQLQPRLGDILACQVFRVYGRIVRIFLSIRTALTACWLAKICAFGYKNVDRGLVV